MSDDQQSQHPTDQDDKPSNVTQPPTQEREQENSHHDIDESIRKKLEVILE